LPYVRPNVEINTVTSILNTPYFSSWLIGFIEAESSFCIYKPIKDSSHIASFEITQTKGEVIILAIKKLFNLIQSIRVDDTNNFKLKVSNIRAIENIINFMDKEPAKLIGYKKIQYIIWLKRLRQIPRYSFKIKIPQNY
jgi:ubiquinol-cytochrome c reductase cytochrome b subunit